MDREINFGSPYSRESQEFFKAAQEWFETRIGPLPRAKHDPLEPYISAYQGVNKSQISIRIEGWILDLTKQMARQHKMPYQKILQIWMAEGLRRAVRDGVEGVQNDDSDGLRKTGE